MCEINIIYRYNSNNKMKEKFNISLYLITNLSLKITDTEIKIASKFLKAKLTLINTCSGGK